jgi:23S rRNA pseudouridine1911/1915/1917 synthase
MRQIRLIKYLKDRYKDMSAREIKRALDMGACLVNGKIERLGSRMIDTQKDKVKFKAIKTQAQEKLVIKKGNIIFEDEDILVYNKSAGHATMAVEGKGVNLHDCLKQELKYKFLEPAHRLDKNTSGLLIFAKNKKSHSVLSEMFANKKIKKTYLAIIDGKWKKKNLKGQIKNYLCLEYKKGSQQKWKVAEQFSPSDLKNPKYKEAISDYEVLKTFKDYNLVQLNPQTGRTHQLRVHMAYIGHPILGDSIYAENFKCTKTARRQLLHAGKLEFNHPINKNLLKLEAGLPGDFKEFLD